METLNLKHFQYLEQPAVDKKCRCHPHRKVGASFVVQFCCSSFRENNFSTKQKCSDLEVSLKTFNFRYLETKNILFFQK